MPPRNQNFQKIEDAVPNNAHPSIKICGTQYPPFSSVSQNCEQVDAMVSVFRNKVGGVFLFLEIRWG